MSLGVGVGLAIGRRGLVASAPVWTPASIPFTQFVMDARAALWQDTGRTIPVTGDGDAVAVWPDLSAAGNDASQANGSYQGGYYTDTVNGNPVVACAFDDYYELEASLNLVNELTIAMVVKLMGSGVYYMYVTESDGIGGPLTRYEVRRAEGANALQVDAYVGGVEQTFTSGTIPLGEFHAVIIRIKTSAPSLVTFEVDGVPAGSGVFSPTGNFVAPNFPVNIGRRTSISPYYIMGDYAYISAHATIVDGADLTALRTYLSIITGIPMP